MEQNELQNQKTQDGFWLTVPRKTAYPHFFETKGEGPDANVVKRVVFKLPNHTPKIKTPEGEVDVSGMSMFVNATSFKAHKNDPNYYSVFVPSHNKDGEPWQVNLKLSEGHFENPAGTTPEEKGAFIVEKEELASVDAKALTDALQERRAAVRAYAEQGGIKGYTLCVPKKTAYMHCFIQDDKEIASLVLPPYTPEATTQEKGPQDISGMTMFVKRSAVKELENDPAYFHVSVPAHNQDGDPWQINLRKSEGHFENPAGTTPEEKGKFVVEDEIKLTITSQDLCHALQERRENTRIYAQAQEQERAWTRAQEAKEKYTPPSLRKEGEKCKAASEAHVSDQSYKQPHSHDVPNPFK